MRDAVIKIAQGELGVTEEWRSVYEYEGLYEVSSFGRVRNAHGKILKPVERRGYMCQNLFKNGKTRDTKIHRLVAIAFIPNPNNYPQVNHKDEDKRNNAVWNLEWCDAKYNANYGTHIERCRVAITGKKKNWSGEGMKRLILSHSKPVVGIHKTTGEVIRFASATEAGKNGFDRHCIQRVANGHEKTHKGYIWYKEYDYEPASSY